MAIATRLWLFYPLALVHRGTRSLLIRDLILVLPANINVLLLRMYVPHGTLAVPTLFDLSVRFVLCTFVPVPSTPLSHPSTSDTGILLL